MHTAVFKDKRGFGGRCFPKDINALATACEKNGYNPELIRKAIEVNDKMLKKNIK
jgi:UDP-glucose 6-dehydrogenase